MNPTSAPPVDDTGGGPPPPTNGSNGSASRASTGTIALGPPRGARSRVPQALLAGLLIVGGGLGGLLLFNRYNQRVPAVVVVAPVVQGAELTRGDLAVTEVAVDRGVATVGSLDELVGRHAAHDLAPGELLGPADVTSRDRLVVDGESVVGLLLEPGQYPTLQLAPGDRVDLFATGSSERSGSAAEVGTARVDTSPLVSDVVVYDVATASSDGRTLLISVVVVDEQAGVIHAAVDGGIRLSLRGQG